MPSPDFTPAPERDAADSSDLPLALIQQALGVVTWVWNIGTRQTRWYGDVSEMLGLPRGSYGGDFASYLERVHPADRERARLRLRACFRGELPVYRSEERVVWPDGQVRWIETYGRASTDAEGRVVQIAGVVRDVTLRRAAEGVDLEAEQRFRQLIELAPVAISMSRGDEIVYGNPRFAAMFGVADPQSLIGRAVMDFIDPAEHPHHLRRTLRREAGEAESASYELSVRRADGSRFPALVSVSRVRLADGPASLVYLHDISDLAEARRALEDERDRAHHYLEIAEALLVALDVEGRVTLVNRKGQQVLGWPGAELLGRSWFEACVPADERAAARERFALLMAGDAESEDYREWRTLARAGHERLIGWRVAVLRDAAGRPCGALASGEDMTERRRAENALRSLNAELESRVAQRTAELAASNAALMEARDRAEIATEAKSRFLADMSHEIRTPMNAVLGFSDLALRQPGLPAKAMQHLGQVRSAALSLLELVSELLDFAKIEAGRLELESLPFELDEVLERARALVGWKAEDKGLALRVERAEGLADTWIGDPLRLGQVLLNLCGNAVKFTAQGEVVLRAEPIGATPGTGLRLLVRDTGCGIEADRLERLFRPFDQLGSSVAREHGGTGLGLAISHGLVQAMGGRIAVHSVPGEGSTFGVELPRLRAAVDAGPPAAAFRRPQHPCLRRSCVACGCWWSTTTRSTGSSPASCWATWPGPWSRWSTAAWRRSNGSPTTPSMSC
jgi:PAS domain S-box-containing protein